MLLWLALGLTPAQAQPLTFASDTGKQAVTLEELLKVSPALDLTVIDPHDGKPHPYRVFALEPWLQRVYGQDYYRGSEYLFLAADGYQAVVDGDTLRRHHPYLAFAAQQGPFQVENVSQHQLVELGPFYLVWDVERNPALKSLGGYLWPYQVLAIDRVDFAKQYSRVLPDPSAPEAVHRGFAAYRKYCLTCHQINGQGGDSSFDLNSPKSVTGYLSVEWLKRFLDDPGKFHGNTKMPPLNRALPDRSQVISDIIEFLRHKARGQGSKQ